MSSTDRIQAAQIAETPATNDTISFDVDGDGNPDTSYETNISMAHYWSNGLGDILLNMDKDGLVFQSVLNEVTLSALKATSDRADADSDGSATSQGDVTWGKTLTAYLGGGATDTNYADFQATPGTAVTTVFGAAQSDSDQTASSSSNSSSSADTSNFTSPDGTSDLITNDSTSLSASQMTINSDGAQIRMDSEYEGGDKGGMSLLDATMNATSNINASYSGFASWKISKGHVVDFKPSV